MLVAVGSFVITGLLTKDKFGALSAGMSGFEGTLQGLGESKWCVLFGRKISVVPEETISSQFIGATWVTLDSCYKTLEELKKRALDGEKLGNLGDVISKLMKKPWLNQQ